MHYPDDVSDITDPRGDLQWGTIPGLVEDAAARFGELEAIVDRHGPDGTTTRLTFDQLAERVATATRAIVANGIDRGDRVAIWAPNCAEWVIAALGAEGAGALLVPLNTRYKGAEAAYILRQSGARILFTVQGFLGVDYPAMLVVTSLNDSQVSYHEPAKYVAKLRAIKTDHNPLLFKCRMDGGHGGASGRYDSLKDVAMQYAFVLAALGTSMA